MSDQQQPAVVDDCSDVAQNLAALFATFSGVSIYDLGDRFAVELNVERKLRRYYGPTLAVALRNAVAIVFG